VREVGDELLPHRLEPAQLGEVGKEGDYLARSEAGDHGDLEAGRSVDQPDLGVELAAMPDRSLDAQLAGQDDEAVGDRLLSDLEEVPGCPVGADDDHPGIEDECHRRHLFEQHVIDPRGPCGRLGHGPPAPASERVPAHGREYMGRHQSGSRRRDLSRS